MYGLTDDWFFEPRLRHFVLEDFEGAQPRWCNACGGHGVLSCVQRIVRDEQIPPEKIVVVSGIGCSSRLPHYMKTYGFHSLHGRPLPVACGIRARRPDLHLFVITGDGDCCAIGTAHWIHAIRYNMKMAVLLFDNGIYGLTKMQSSPTSHLGDRTNTHPLGTPLSPLNPLAVTLSITNASFVAQAVDWNPPLLQAVVSAAHRHPGLAFIRIIQRCPHYRPHLFSELQADPSKTLLLTHPDGIPYDESVTRTYRNRLIHDPSDLHKAQELVRMTDVLPVGLLYRNEAAERYDLECAHNIGMSPKEKQAAVERELDRFII